MSPKLRDPESHQPITSLDELDRAARRVAGLPEWDMDDPGRPFTPEYDDSMKEPEAPMTEPVVSEAPAVVTTDDETEDTTPSADNRDLYSMPTPTRLNEIRRQKALEHIRNMKLVVKAAQEKDSKDIKTSA